jgi:hypothetical protein
MHVLVNVNVTHCLSLQTNSNLLSLFLILSHYALRFDSVGGGTLSSAHMRVFGFEEEEDVF